MNLQEFRHLQAEKTTLDKLLSTLPSSSVIERMSLEARKKEVEKKLDSQPEPPIEPVRAKLTFRGKPIIGSHGMFAEFGAAVVNIFAETVATIGASQIEPLGLRGAIPNRENFQLLITGTALGSFGFELEESPKDNMMFLPGMSPIEAAINKLKTIMEATLGTDDDLIEAISDADPRALEELRTFLKTMADHEAVCTLEFKDEVFRFSDVGQVRRSEQRLIQDNIHKEDKDIVGEFQGFLPKRRTFEFVISETNEVISGKIDQAIRNAGEINHILEKPSIIKVHTKRIGKSRPRYILFEYKET
jgi:hypothetical protein